MTLMLIYTGEGEPLPPVVGIPPGADISTSLTCSGDTGLPVFASALACSDDTGISAFSSDLACTDIAGGVVTVTTDQACDPPVPVFFETPPVGRQGRFFLLF